MSKNMSSTNQRYEDANRSFNQAYKNYAGEAGLNSATNYANTQAQEQADKQSLRAGTQAGATANKSARTSGLSKAQAALMGEQASSDTTGNIYNDVYNNTRTSSLNAALENNQAAVNARGTQLQSSQDEGQNAYNRAWGNVGGVGSMVTGLLTSDERLKKAVNVSSDSNPEDYECFKCSTGIRRTSLADIATELYNFGNDIRMLHLYAAGKNFIEYHKKLNELYDEVFKAYDDVAELAISKGEKVPNPSSKQSAFNSYKPLDPTDYNSEQITQEVLNRGNKVLDILKHHGDYEGFVVSKLDDVAGKLDKLINYIFKRSAIDFSTSIASDERLKTFREVSKSLGNNPADEKTSSYNLLKVTYKHNKGE